MPGPARAGVLIYAKDLEALSRFYEQLLGLRLLAADNEHRVAENDDVQLVLHAIPTQFAADVVITAPPQPRERQAIKPFFTVPSLAAAEADAKRLGGFVFGPTWDGPGFKVRNACDPEGNIIQLRERVGSDARAHTMRIPPGFNTVAPYFFSNDAPALLRFLVDGLGGEEVLRHVDGERIANAQVRLGASTVMVSQSSTAFPAMPASIYLYVEDVDAAMAKALAAGATKIMDVADMPYQDRQGGVRDPCGNVWWLSQRLVDGPY